MISSLLLAAMLQRTILPSQPGPNRLDPDAALLARARTDLGDLRIVDAGREVPYLVIAPKPATPQWIAGHILPRAATKKTSGFELDLGAIRSVDRFRVEGIPAPFLKRVRLEGSGDGAHWTLLAPDATLFDLPDDKLRNLELAFTPGDYRYVFVTWDDRSSAVVTTIGSASARLHDATAPAEPVRVTLPFRRIASEPHRSRYRMTLPGPNLPIAAIEPVVDNGDVFRHAEVFAQRLENGTIEPVPLGSSTLKRAMRYGGVAADMAVPVARPDVVDLELVVDDADNPPLAIRTIDARLDPLPWIWFDSATSAPLTARYGDERLQPPHYDVEASRNAIARTSPPAARWDTTEQPAKLPDSETTAIASFRGATVDRSNFRYARPVPAAPAGVARLALDADVLVRSHNVSDVRLVDASNRQVPYIVENCSAPLTLPLHLGARTQEGSQSHYALDLPYDSLPAGASLVLTTSSHVFSRQVALRNERDRECGSESWQGTEADLAAPTLALSLACVRTRHAELVVDEGDNAPLPITSATLQMPAVALRFYHSGTPLTLLYGNTQATTPQYDLAILAPRVMGEPARELALATLSGVPKDDGGTETKVFWAALALATLGLLAVLARLVKSGAVA